MQRTPRIPSLRVITTGGAATAAGLMQSQRLRDTLEALRRQAGYVVIEAPSTSSSADAQSLASLADAAILAVELRRARRPALLDAAEQLRRVGTPLLGAVVLPRLRRAADRRGGRARPWPLRPRRTRRRKPLRHVGRTRPPVARRRPDPADALARPAPSRRPAPRSEQPTVRSGAPRRGDEVTASIELTPSTASTASRPTGDRRRRSDDR